MGAKRKSRQKDAHRNGLKKEPESTHASKTKRQDTAQDDGSVRSMIRDELRSLVKDNPTLQWSDFDGLVRQYLHAIHGIGGPEKVRDALEVVDRSTREKPRAWAKNWSAYLNTCLKKFLNGMPSLEDDNSMMSGHSLPFIPILSCMPMGYPSPPHGLWCWSLPRLYSEWDCSALHAVGEMYTTTARDSSKTCDGRHSRDCSNDEPQWGDEQGIIVLELHKQTHSEDTTTEVGDSSFDSALYGDDTLEAWQESCECASAEAWSIHTLDATSWYSWNSCSRDDTDLDAESVDDEFIVISSLGKYASVAPKLEDDGFLVV
jgi:hypothetical protein